MQYNRVLLISPPSTSRYGGLRIPSGIGYIAQSLKDNQIEYEYVDMRIGYSERYLFKKINAYKPQLIGVSMITLEYQKTYNLLNRLKTMYPDIKIVVGGHHITILKEEVLKDCTAIDLGVVHDGEYTILDICKGKLPVEAIPGLIYRSETGDIIFTGNRPLEVNLDNYSFPKYERFKMSDYSNQIPIHSSRGCKPNPL